ncbi:siderophore-interacting protein [Pantoea ananatis]|uniref:siderophore-interacting protein n=1 Tax=Pantoea ananas TaxID=553 RepID=UPI000DA6C89B|nr:siderophore-interacting protein [Pantoea ananatis]PZD66638.1 NADPH-dependent ferric siderophore reductase [Pantoea ananatis]
MQPRLRRVLVPTSYPRRLPERVRNELRFRAIHVAEKTRIAETFWRIVFTGDDLKGFNSPGFDDHIKVFFPPADGAPLALPTINDDGIQWQGGLRPVARDYTPLAFDGASSLTLDFYIHDSGVASDWASQAQPGDRLIIGGPRGSLLVPTDYAFQLYVCDETGLPAFRRRSSSVEAQALHLFACADEVTGQAYLGDIGNASVNWLGSGKMTLADLPHLTAALDRIAIPQHDAFIWLTGEGQFVKQLCDYFTTQRGVDADLVRAVAYWHQKPATVR